MDVGRVQGTKPQAETAKSLKPLREQVETGFVRVHDLYDQTTDHWKPENMPAGPAVTSRFIGMNQAGGPQVPMAALVTPDAYSVTLTNKGHAKQPKGVDYVLGEAMKPIVLKMFCGKGPDEVPGMPVEMVRKIESYLQPGDIVLQGNDPDGRTGTRDQYMHGLLYLGKGPDGQGYVVHSIGVPRETTAGTLKPGVRITTWEQAIQRDVDGADRLQVLRPTHMTQQDFNRMTEWVVGQVGKPYDFRFNSGSDKRYYCTELLKPAMDLVENGPRLKPDQTMPRFAGAITGRCVQLAAARGEFETVLTLNPKVHPRQ